MLIFVSHERNDATGASVYLRYLYFKCLEQKKFYTFSIGSFKKINMMMNIIKLINIRLKYKGAIFHLNTITNLYLAVFCRIFSFKFVLHVHETQEFIGNAFWKQRMIRFVEEHIIFVDPRFQKSFPMSAYIKNTVDLEGLEYFKERDPETVVYAVVGSIDCNKNQLAAVEFLSDKKFSKKVHLKFIGPCTNQDYLAKLKAKIQSAAFNIDICGIEDRSKLHSQYDVLIACSKYESFGLAVAEALCLCKPVIFLNPSAYPSEFLQFCNALSDPSSIDDLRITKLLEQSKTMAKKQNHLAIDNLLGLNDYYAKRFDISHCFQ